MADLAKYLKPDPRLKELSTGDGNFILRDMDDELRHSEFSSIPRFCAYVTQKEHVFKIVDHNSATRGCQDTIAIDANHGNLVKPCDVRSLSYIALANKVRTVKLENRSDRAPGGTGVTVSAPNGIAIGGGFATGDIKVGPWDGAGAEGVRGAS